MATLTSSKVAYLSDGMLYEPVPSTCVGKPLKACAQCRDRNWCIGVRFAKGYAAQRVVRHTCAVCGDEWAYYVPGQADGHCGTCSYILAHSG